MLKLLAISGSLRAASVNTSILQALTTMFPAGTSYRIWDGLGGLPHFSPEIDGEASPGTVRAYRGLLSAADAILICTPEYAFGMPGVLKNALDWTVSTGEYGRKPVARISASPLTSGGAKAHAWLSQTLEALGARQAEETSLIVPSVKGKTDGQGQLQDAPTLAALQHLTDALVEQIRAPLSW